MKMLVCLDRSSFSEAILPAASKLAATPRAEVTLVTVVEAQRVHATRLRERDMGLMGASDPFIARSLAGPPAEAVGTMVETIVQAGQRARAEAMDYLESAGREYFGGKAEAVVLEGGDIAEELLRYARTEEFDVIAVATHGRSGLARLVLGSVAQRLVTAGGPPVLVLRPNNLHSNQR